jgi:hypothetical protein
MNKSGVDLCPFNFWDKDIMTAKTLFVSSAVQAALMREIFIPELMDGFWKNHRPQGHGEVWRDVQVAVSTDGTLGPVGFEAPRNYNFLNLTFAIPNEARLVAVAQAAKPSSTFKSVKKELIELGRIVGSRLPSRDATPVKLFRGNHKPGTETVCSPTRARAGLTALGTAVQAPIKPKAATPKKTVVKAPSVVDKNVTIQRTSSGATVRRVAV